MMSLRQSKDDYLTSDKMAPRQEDPEYKAWRWESNMVMSWLINSRESDLGQTFMFYGMAEEIWDVAR